MDQAPEATRDRPVEREPFDPRRVDQTIAFWEGRVAADPIGAIDLRELAGAYLTRQRETGAIQDAVLAERAARRSMEVLPHRNAVALNRLARSLMAQHRFPEALAVAKDAAEVDPEAHRLIADLALELGDYEAADRALAAIADDPEDLNRKALRARILEINGKADEALALLREASQQAEARSDLPHETAAWYWTMVGHHLIDAGRLDEGEHACRRALELFPNDYRALTGLAEASAWRGDWGGAIDRGLEAIAICPENPEVLRLLGDAQTARGNAEEAGRSYRRFEALAHSFPRIYDRHWALFCADQDRDLDEALAIARKDLELRQDVHAYDTLAWVCYKAGRLDEAAEIMPKALARGTQDASMYSHAGLIARARDDKGEAKAMFLQARAINPLTVPVRWIRWLED